MEPQDGGEEIFRVEDGLTKKPMSFEKQHPGLVDCNGITAASIPIGIGSDTELEQDPPVMLTARGNTSLIANIFPHGEDGSVEFIVLYPEGVKRADVMKEIKGNDFAKYMCKPTQVILFLLMILLTQAEATNLGFKNISCLRKTDMKECNMQIHRKMDKKIITEVLNFNIKGLADKTDETCDIINKNKFNGRTRKYNDTLDVFRVSQRNIFIENSDDIFPEMTDDLIEFVTTENLIGKEFPVGIDRTEIKLTRINLYDIDLPFSFTNIFKSNTIRDVEIMGTKTESFIITGHLNILLRMQQLLEQGMKHLNDSSISIDLFQDRHEIRATFTVIKCPLEKCPSSPNKGVYMLNFKENRFTPVITEIHRVKGIANLKCKFRIASRFSLNNKKPEYNTKTTLKIQRTRDDILMHTCFAYITEKKYDSSLPFILKSLINLKRPLATNNMVCSINLMQTFVSEHIVFNNKREKRALGWIVTSLAGLLTRGAGATYNAMSMAAGATLSRTASTLSLQTAGRATGRLGQLLNRAGVRTPLMTARIAMERTKDRAVDLIKAKAVTWFTKENVKKMSGSFLKNGLIMGGIAGATEGTRYSMEDDNDDNYSTELRKKDSAMFHGLSEILADRKKYANSIFSIGEGKRNSLVLVDIPYSIDNNLTYYEYNTSINQIGLKDRKTYSFKRLEKMEEQAILILLEREEIMNIIFNLFSNNLLLPDIRNQTSDNTYIVNLLSQSSISQSLMERNAETQDMGFLKVFKTPVMENNLFVKRKNGSLHCLTASLDNLENDCKKLTNFFFEIFQFGKDRVMITGNNEGRISCGSGNQYISKADYSGIIIPEGCRIKMKRFMETDAPELDSQIENLQILFTEILDLKDYLGAGEITGIIIILICIILIITGIILRIIKERINDVQYNINIFRPVPVEAGENVPLE